MSVAAPRRQRAPGTRHGPAWANGARTAGRVPGRRPTRGLAAQERERYVGRQLQRLFALLPECRAMMKRLADLGARWDGATPRERAEAVETAEAVTLLLATLSECFGDRVPPLRIHIGGGYDGQG